MSAPPAFVLAAATAVKNVATKFISGYSGSTCQIPDVKKIVPGGRSTCAVFVDGSVKCRGNNQFGGLGLGDTNHRGDDPNEVGDKLSVVNLGAAKTVAPGTHSCAILNNNSVKCWGWNDFGQLGLGDISHRGDEPNEIGDNLPAVNLGSGRTAKTISVAGLHACAILDNNSVKCWGRNDVGQLGLGDKNDRGDQANEMGDNLPVVNLGSGRTAKTIATGVRHSCAILDNNSVKCWGGNDVGQLGLGDISHRGDEPNATPRRAA